MLAANGRDLRTVALRPHLIWGPGDPHILPRLAAKARGGSLALPGPDKLVDTVFVADQARLTYSHVDRIIAGGIMPAAQAVTLEAGKEMGVAVKLKGFVRYEVGEGIEKAASDFAAEVASFAQPKQ